MAEDRSKTPTLDEPAPAAKTRYVTPYADRTGPHQAHVDHSVSNPRARSPSASQMGAAAPTVVDEGVRGVLARADFEGGDFVIRLASASASMRAMAQLTAAAGLEIEIVVRRRTT